MLTVSDVIAQYLDQKAAQVLAGLLTGRANDKSRFYCLAFAKDFGSQLVSACKRGDLKRFLVNHPEYRSAFTKHDAAGQVVTCFRWAADEGLIQVCPYTKPRDLPTPQPRQPITAAEVRAILNRARTEGYRSTRVAFRLALWFLWETGVRTCELYKLDWSQWDAARGCFVLDSKTTAKTGAKRILALSARAWRLIRLLLRKDKRVSGPVFVNGRGRRWNKGTFGKLFRKHADGAGVRKEVSAYCARHGFCCEALEAGAGERQLADYLGHSNTRYIAWYGRGVRQKVEYLRAIADLRRK